MSALTIDDRSDLRRWALSGAFVLCVYGAIGASFVQWSAPPDDPGDYGNDTIMLELTPEQDQGPIVPTVTKPEQKPPEIKTEQLPVQQSEAMLPAVPPTPPPPKPDITPVKPPTPVVQPAAAAPDPRTVMQQQARALASVKNWKSAIAKLLEHNKRYPSEARARGEQGVALVAFSIDQQGKLLASRIAKSSGFAELDSETLALLQRAQPFPAPPPTITTAEIKFVVPVQFSIE